MWPFAVELEAVAQAEQATARNDHSLAFRPGCGGFCSCSAEFVRMARPGFLVRSADGFFIGGLISALCALFWSLGGVANPDRSGAAVGGVLPGLDASEPCRRMSDFLLYLDRRLTPARLQPDQRLLLLNPPSGYPAHLASHRLSSYAKYV